MLFLVSRCDRPGFHTQCQNKNKSQKSLCTILSKSSLHATNINSRLWKKKKKKKKKDKGFVFVLVGVTAPAYKTQIAAPLQRFQVLGDLLVQVLQVRLHGSQLLRVLGRRPERNIVQPHLVQLQHGLHMRKHPLVPL